MKRKYFILILFFITVITVRAQISRGFVKESLVINSKVLHKKVTYSIYLPFDYNSSTRYYPVVYLLHGFTDNDKGWIQYGEANMIADEAIAERQIPPMILVMPDAGLSWYINNYNKKVNYEEFFFKEFIPYIEAKYRILKQKRFRGVAGLSMGGYGALVYAMKHPEMFSACAAFSAAVFTDTQYIRMSPQQWNNSQAVLFGKNLKGKARLTSVLKNNSPLHLVDSLQVQKLKSVRYYIDCGDDDFLSIGNSMLHIKMIKRRVPHEYRVRNGKHQWSYWRSGLKKGLQFIGTSFQHK